MTKQIIFIVFLFTSITSSSQNKKKNSKETVLAFSKNYNKVNYETVFNMFNFTMKNAMPLEKTIGFFKSLRLNRGKIKENYIPVKNDKIQNIKL